MAPPRLADHPVHARQGLMRRICPHTRYFRTSSAQTGNETQPACPERTRSVQSKGSPCILNSFPLSRGKVRMGVLPYISIKKAFLFPRHYRICGTQCVHIYDSTGTPLPFRYIRMSAATRRPVRPEPVEGCILICLCEPPKL